MHPEILINEWVDVIPAFYAGVANNKICMPRRMRYRGQEITFTKLGMRHPTSKGRHMIHVFDMSDGTNDYRLEFDARRLRWELVSITEGRYI